MRCHRRTRQCPALRFCIAVAVALVFLIAAVAAQNNAWLTVEQVKAAFLYNFTKYTEWHGPADYEPQVVHICVFDSRSIADELEKSVAGKASGNRVVHIRRLQPADSLFGCEVAFLGGRSKKNIERLLAAASAYPVLTVSDADDFMAEGGMVRFVAEENRVRFDINQPAAAKVNIRFDSRLLALARTRIEGTP